MRRLRVPLGSIACLLVFAVSAFAASGTLTGTVTGVGPRAAREGVEAVNAQGVIGGVGSLTASGSYHLTLAPGAWIVVAGAQAGDKSLTALGSPVLVRPGATSHAKHARAKAGASAAAAQGLPAGSVITVEPILLEDERQCQGAVACPTEDFTAAFTNDLFQRCASRGITFVDTSVAFQKFAAQEAALSRSGRLAVPFAYRPLTPKYAVAPDTGNDEEAASGVIGPNDVTIHVTVVFAGSELGVSRDLMGPDLDVSVYPKPIVDSDILTAVHREAAGLAAKMCGG